MHLINNGLARLSFYAASIGLVCAAVIVPTTVSALPIAGGVTVRFDGTGSHRVKLGPTTQQTCFLSGLSGDFRGNATLYTDPIKKAISAVAEVVEEKGFWVLHLDGGTGSGVGASAICIFATANRAETSWADNVTGGSVPGKANRHCFLSAVFATTGFGASVWGAKSPAAISVREPNAKSSDFVLNGVVHNVAGDQDYGGGAMRCVDFTATSQWGFTLAGPTNAVNSATNTITLRDSPTGPAVPVANVGCFLTGIVGTWASPSPDPLGLVDGVFLTGDPKVSKNWKLTASNGRTGTVRCFR
jgi:hypothetical protein